MGTYVYGIFDNDQFRIKFINMLRRRKGLSPQHSLQRLPGQIGKFRNWRHWWNSIARLMYCYNIWGYHEQV